MVWGPRAPSGAGFDSWSVCTSPAPSVARTSMVWEPAAASQSYSHWTHVAFEIGVDSLAAAQSPPSMLTCRALMPRSGAHATPATGTCPALTFAPSWGTSIRDCVRIGAFWAHPGGTQNPSTWSKRVRVSFDSHFVADT